MTTLKEKLEAQWNCAGVQFAGNVTVWQRGYPGDLRAEPGADRTPTVGKSAEAFMRKVRAHWGPAPMTYCGDAKLPIPKWLRERYKRECPNNYATLIAEYGKGVTKLDLAVNKLTFREAFGHDPRNGY